MLCSLCSGSYYRCLSLYRPLISKLTEMSGVLTSHLPTVLGINLPSPNCESNLLRPTNPNSRQFVEQTSHLPLPAVHTQQCNNVLHNFHPGDKPPIFHFLPYTLNIATTYYTTSTPETNLPSSSSCRTNSTMQQRITQLPPRRQTSHLPLPAVHTQHCNNVLHNFHPGDKPPIFHFLPYTLNNATTYYTTSTPETNLPSSTSCRTPSILQQRIAQLPPRILLHKGISKCFTSQSL